MGRRGIIKNKTGCVCLVLVSLCLLIFYASWKSLIVPDLQVTRDSYTLQRQQMFYERDKWQRRQEISSDESGEHNRLEKADSGRDIKLQKQGLLSSSPPLIPVNVSVEETSRISVPFKSLETNTNISKSLDFQPQVAYHPPVQSLVPILSSMEHLVYFNLGKMSPRLAYLQSFFPLVKRLGATGLLVDYAHVFPTTRRTGRNQSRQSNLVVVEEVVKLAEMSGLKIMPLIDTLRWLKLSLKAGVRKQGDMDDAASRTARLSESYNTLAKIIKQVLETHYEVSYFHIGCSGISLLGQEVDADDQQVSRAFLQHVQRVAKIIKNADATIKPIIWDDGLRTLNSLDITNSQLPSLVDIMVWHFSANVYNSIGKDVWTKYGNLFKSVWAASAYRGNVGQRQIVNEPTHYYHVSLSWLNVFFKCKEFLAFKGVVLTGWQGKERLALTSELLPVTIPSLAVCLATMTHAGLTKEVHTQVSNIIQCDHPVEMRIFTRGDHSTQRCRFPGFELYSAVHKFQRYMMINAAPLQKLETWLSKSEMGAQVSSLDELQVLSDLLHQQISDYTVMSNFLRQYMEPLYPQQVVDDWLNATLNGKLTQLKLMDRKITDLMKDISPSPQHSALLEAGGPGTNNLHGHSKDGGSLERELSLQMGYLDTLQTRNHTLLASLLHWSNNAIITSTNLPLTTYALVSEHLPTSQYTLPPVDYSSTPSDTERKNFETATKPKGKESSNLTQEKEKIDQQVLIDRILSTLQRGGPKSSQASQKFNKQSGSLLEVLQADLLNRTHNMSPVRKQGSLEASIRIYDEARLREVSDYNTRDTKLNNVDSQHDAQLGGVHKQHPVPVNTSAYLREPDQKERRLRPSRFESEVL